MSRPLADRRRPTDLDQIRRQARWIGDEGPLRQMLDRKRLRSVVLWGPPGCGKTTIARAMAQHTEALFLQISAVLDGVKQLRGAIERAEVARDMERRTTVLFVDEIHRWNKAQQDALLPHVESGLLVLIGGVSAFMFIGAIFLFITKEGLDFMLNRMELSTLLFGSRWEPTVEPPEYGAFPLIMGTLWITAVAMIIGVPLAFAAAVYVGEFARGKQREWLKIGIEILAAIPSVVWGVIGLYVMAPLIKSVFDVEIGLNVLNAGIILGLMAAPIIATIAEDALKAVPESYREAAESLGATRWQVIWKVVLPHARPGLSAAVLLGVGRAFGETIAVLMASGHRLMAPTDVMDSAATLTATIAAELGEAAVGSDHYQVLFVLGLLLFLITFSVNLIADRIVRGRKAAK